MLTMIAWIALVIGIICSIVILIDVVRHPQQMAIMNVVWPVNGWFFGPIAIWTYYKWGRKNAKNLQIDQQKGEMGQGFVSTSHCASGCTLGDIVGVPIVAITGLTIVGSTLFAHYFVEFVLAYVFGILFQFLAIYPMNKKQGIRNAIKSAIKADTISLIAFEIGMFGWMALVHYVFFTQPPAPSQITYWFMMQIAMILGFLTSFPANKLLVRKGIKHAM
ncbi:DUF4396 domain-containing protein [Paraliobacillus ryukyuensis]|uniref:DUF4396 domain-containing protein n=1 Tax=Paraliobacillus ryukyuensis TaxID=200904 RepID=UPI0009A7385C|nr:DUF4396 domain-containing protein [Paraliobacillus ryukyuensis]